MSLIIVTPARWLRNIRHELTSKSTLPIRGAEGILINFANCCRPIPNDPIVAHVSPGRGLVIHLETCRNIRGYEKEPQKYLTVEWEHESMGGFDFKTGVQVELINHQGALAELANVIASTGSNIHSISSDEKDGRIYVVTLLISAQNRVHLAKIMRRIRVMPDALRVSRARA